MTASSIVSSDLHQMAAIDQSKVGSLGENLAGHASYSMDR